MFKRIVKESWKERIIHGILMPGAFLIIILTAILPFLGYNLGAFVTNIGVKPMAFIENTFAAEVDHTEEELARVKSQLKQRDKQIATLQQDISSKTDEIDLLEAEIKSLAKNEAIEKENKKERIQKQQELAAMYESMTPSKSAGIIKKLTLHEGALLLNEMGSTEQAAILGRLSTNYAADITVAMRDLNKAEEPELAALQERLSLLMSAVNYKEESIDISNLADEISELPKERAASILVEMSKEEESLELAVAILTQIDRDKRISLLAAMDEQISSVYVSKISG